MADRQKCYNDHKIAKVIDWYYWNNAVSKEKELVRAFHCWKCHINFINAQITAPNSKVTLARFEIL